MCVRACVRACVRIYIPVAHAMVNVYICVALAIQICHTRPIRSCPNVFLRCPVFLSGPALLIKGTCLRLTDNSLCLRKEGNAYLIK